MPITLPLEQLGSELKRRRRERQLSLRAVELQTGVSPATLSRLERGNTPDLSVVEKIANWLGVSVATAGAQRESLSSTVKTDEDLKRTIAVHLRANKKLSSELAEAIAETFDMVVRLELEKQKKKRG